MRTMLKSENLTATVGEDDDAKTIINGLTLDVPKGEVHAIMGPNGAGTTTCFYMLTGLVPVDAGSTEIDGHDVSGVDQALAEACARLHQRPRN